MAINPVLDLYREKVEGSPVHRLLCNPEFINHDRDFAICFEFREIIGTKFANSKTEGALTPVLLPK